MKARILVIDDEAEVRDTVRMILRYDDYEVIEASSGPEGMALAEREAPDLVFLDIKMPGMDGLEVLQRLRAANEDLPVVIVSAHGTVSTALEADRPARSTSSRSRRRRTTCWFRSAMRSSARAVGREPIAAAALEVRHQMVGESPSLRQVWDASSAPRRPTRPC